MQHDCNMECDTKRPPAPDQFAHIRAIVGMFLMPIGGASAASNHKHLWKTRARWVGLEPKRRREVPESVEGVDASHTELRADIGDGNALFRSGLR